MLQTTIIGPEIGLKIRNSKVSGFFSLTQPLYGFLILILAMADKDGCLCAWYTFLERNSLSDSLRQVRQAAVVNRVRNGHMTMHRSAKCSLVQRKTCRVKLTISPPGVCVTVFAFLSTVHLLTWQSEIVCLASGILGNIGGHNTGPIPQMQFCGWLQIDSKYSAFLTWERDNKISQTQVSEKNFECFNFT